MEALEVTVDNLNDVMGINARPIIVHEDGTVTRDTEHWMSELLLETSEDAELYKLAKEDGWGLLSGYTAQQGYNGPVLHFSERITGKLAEDILATPGTYGALLNQLLI